MGAPSEDDVAEWAKQAPFQERDPIVWAAERAYWRGRSDERAAAASEIVEVVFPVDRSHKPLYPWWRRGRRRLWTVRIAMGLAGLLLSLASWWVHEQYMRAPWTW